MSELKSHSALLLQAVGALNEVNLTGKLSVGETVDNEGEGGSRRTTLVGIAPVTGTVDVTYDRLPLNEIAEGKIQGTLVIRASEMDKAALVSLLRTQFNLNVTEADLSEGIPATEDSEAVRNISITVPNDSLLFEGDLNVIVMPMLEGQETPSLVNIPGQPLYPTDNLVEPAVTENVQITGTHQVKSNGTLLNGTGNPATDMTVASNGEISLAIGPRIWKQGVTIPAESGIYSYSIADTQDWNFAFSIALDPAIQDKTLLDLYDITMTWGYLGAEVPQFIKWTAQPGEPGKIKLVSHDGNMEIVDSVGGTQVIQNIQRITHYLNNNGVSYFQPSELNGLGSPLGDYQFVIRAVRKNSVADVVEVNVIAQISAVVTEPEPQ